MKRWEFVGLLGAAALSFPRPGYAQTKRICRWSYRWADSHYDHLPALATELVRRRAAVIANEQHSADAHCESGDHNHSDRF